MGVGLHFKIPLIDRVANRISIKEKVLDFPPQRLLQKTMSQCKLIPSYILPLLTQNSIPMEWSGQ